MKVIEDTSVKETGSISKNNKWYKEPFVIEFWHRLLIFLEKISVFYFLRSYLPNLKKSNGDFVFPKWRKFLSKNFFIVDLWVVLNNILAIIFIALVQLNIPIWLKYVFLIYGTLRVFEIFIYQLNVIFVHPYKINAGTYALKSYRRMTIMLLHNFFEIVCWFAGTYLLLNFMQFSKTDVNVALNQSFLQMITYNMEIAGEKPKLLARTILQLQAVIGVFMTVLSFARFTSLLPKPNTLDDSEKEVDISKLISKLSAKIDNLQEEIQQLKKD